MSILCTNIMRGCTDVIRVKWLLTVTSLFPQFNNMFDKLLGNDEKTKSNIFFWVRTHCLLFSHLCINDHQHTGCTIYCKCIPHKQRTSFWIPFKGVWRFTRICHNARIGGDPTPHWSLRQRGDPDHSLCWELPCHLFRESLEVLAVSASSFGNYPPLCSTKLQKLLDQL